MDYLCGKIGDCSFNRFGSIVLTDRQTDRHTESHTDTQTDANERFTTETLVRSE